MDHRIRACLRRVLGNEKGGVLFYVLIIAAIFAILSPIILNSLSTEKLASIRMEDNTHADVLAAGGAESFIGYLRASSNPDALSTFQAYPGWGVKSITSPSGKRVQLEQYVPGGASHNYAPSSLPQDVLIVATSGRAIKKYLYNINTSSGLQINPGHLIAVPSGTRTILYEKGETVTGKGLNNTVQKLPGINKAISDYKAALGITNCIASYSNLTGCYGSLPPSEGNMDINGNTLFNRTVVADNVTINGGQLTVNGDFYITGSLQTNNLAGTIKVTGNLYVNGNFTIAQDGDSAQVGGMVYVGGTLQITDFSQTNPTAIQFNNLVAGRLEIKGKTKLEVAGQLIVEANMSAVKDSEIIAGGDILVGGYFDGNGILMMQVGGLFADGAKNSTDKLDIKTPNTVSEPKVINVGTKLQTSLQCSDGTSVLNGCSGWSISRKELPPE
ncbi:hypothetical protein [Paenibacillus sp. SI8]|uniref:hypothetical protein n=1 Tax=unclassified Paenibacillus TaxID=185978 RepID=UPI0034672FD2